MATQRVTPGAWVRVRIDGDPWPVMMAIGDTEPAPAFIDHIRDGRGRITTTASRRCPQLRPGRHDVTVTSDTGTIQTQIIVT